MGKLGQSDAGPRPSDSPAYQETLDRWGLGAGAIDKSEALR